MNEWKECTQSLLTTNIEIDFPWKDINKTNPWKKILEWTIEVLSNFKSNFNVLDNFKKKYPEYSISSENSINNFTEDWFIFVKKDWINIVYDIENNIFIQTEKNDELILNKNILKDKYISVIKNINNKNINKDKLMDFIFLMINFIEKLGKNKKIFFLKILNYRLKDIENNDIQWIKVLITSLKDFFYSNPLSKWEDYKYEYLYKIDEIFLRENILNENLDNSNKISYSNIDWKINNISIFIENTWKNMFNTIKTILESKSQDKNFILNILYIDKKTKIIYEKLLAKYKNKINFIYSIDSVWVSWKKFAWIWARDWAVIWPWWTIIESCYSYQGNKLKNRYDSLAIATWKDILQSSLFIQWWNIRQTKNKLFIWIDDILWSISKLRKDWITYIEEISYVENITQKEINNVVNILKKEFWKEKIIIIWWDIDENWNYIIKNWETQWDLYHIDLYLTPISDNEVILWKLEEWNPLNKQLEREAKKLEKLWIKVNRINNIKSNIENNWALTYNNCLIEKYVDENWKKIKTVYLPEYDYESLLKSRKSKEKFNLSEEQIKKSNIRAKNSYENLWFEVVQIPVNWIFVNSWWSLNCLTFENR